MVNKIPVGNVETYQLNIHSSGINYAMVSTPNSVDKIAVSVAHNTNSLGPVNAEYLFLASLGCSFTCSFMEIVRKRKLTVDHYTCNVIGEIQKKGIRTFWHNIHIYPHVFLKQGGSVKRINLCLKKAEKSALLICSINTEINICFHSFVQIINNIGSRNLDITIHGHFAKATYQS